jgi:serine/threonine protein kinase
VFYRCLQINYSEGCTRDGMKWGVRGLGVAHRDIKPENIMLRRAQRPPHLRTRDGSLTRHEGR